MLQIKVNDLLQLIINGLHYKQGIEQIIVMIAYRQVITSIIGAPVSYTSIYTIMRLQFNSKYCKTHYGTGAKLNLYIYTPNIFF